MCHCEEHGDEAIQTEKRLDRFAHALMTNPLRPLLAGAGGVGLQRANPLGEL
jgi:hypothetical protein